MARRRTLPRRVGLASLLTGVESRQFVVQLFQQKERSMRLRSLLCIVFITLSGTALLAQQTGSISGRVTATDGSALPGVTVEGRSNVLPQPRVTVTDGAGDYRLPALIPGDYTVTYSLAGMQTVNRKATVILSQNTVADVKLGLAGVTETITVTAAATLVD